MSGISSLTKAISGLNAAQKGLQVTSHNLSNVNTPGYTRQQLLQSDSPYLTIGQGNRGTMQVGLGVSCDEIRQIRDELADQRLRTETSVLSYYQTLNTTVGDVASFFDEPYGNTVSDLINRFWSQAQKLNTAPDGVEERMSFISTAQVLMSRINGVMKDLETTQVKLNQEIQGGVERINHIAKEIRQYNDKIATAELKGDHANDYRDARNLLLDELSQYGEVSYFEEANKQIQVIFEGHTLVNRQHPITMKIEKREGNPYGLPTWSDNGQPVFDLQQKSTTRHENDRGSLKALLIARGDKPFDEKTTWQEIALDSKGSVDEEGNTYMIPKVQKLLNDFTCELVGMVNKCFTGTGIGIYEGVQGVQFFVPIEGEMEDPHALRAGNIKVNDKLLENGGYNRLGTVSSKGEGQEDNKGDNEIIKDFLTQWGTAKEWYGEGVVNAPYKKVSTLTAFFSEMITEVGGQGKLYGQKALEKQSAVTNIENERSAIGGVSSDEEFSSMLKYQYAYNASARMITMLDGMMDTLINKM